ncbi:hypothetical protein HJG60_010241 [Phyllostomus discolor]|uniref:Uncharacterized protein n=1 Tax=Phyllostomus discolor TaxID=89673 RepID=A0A834B2D1_9CHIR|nr:hypothetical protein HJG60_010241 [Phyllostomus discolor]
MAGRRVTVGNPSPHPQNPNRETSPRSATETGRDQKGREENGNPSLHCGPTPCTCSPLLTRLPPLPHPHAGDAPSLPPARPPDPEVRQPPRVPCGSPRTLDSTKQGRSAERLDQPAGQANRPNTSSAAPLTPEPPRSAVNLTSAGRC